MELPGQLISDSLLIGIASTIGFECCLLMELPELHADLFSRHASPLEVYVFVVVDERGEDVMSDEIFRRCKENSKEGGVAAEACSSQTGL